MIEVYRICEALSTTINNREWSHVFTAHAGWVVSKFAEDVTDLTVTLVPESLSHLKLTKGSSHVQADAVLSIIVQARKDDGADVTELATLVSHIDKMMRDLGEVETSDGKWTVSRSAATSIVPVREHLEQFSVFTCGIVVTLRAILS